MFKVQSGSALCKDFAWGEMGKGKMGMDESRRHLLSFICVYQLLLPKYECQEISIVCGNTEMVTVVYVTSHLTYGYDTTLCTQKFF